MKLTSIILSILCFGLGFIFIFVGLSLITHGHISTLWR